MKISTSRFATLMFAGLVCMLFANFKMLTDEDQLPFFQKATSGWYEMKVDAQISVDELLQLHHVDLGFGPNDKLVNYKKETDDLGITHYRFQQYHRDIKVQGATLLVHEKAGSVISFNGDWFSGLDLEIGSSVSKEDAVSFALGHFPAESYIWNDPAAEQMIRRIERREDASFYPQPELVWLRLDQSDEEKNYQLAYKMEVQASSPLFHEEVYIDAMTGELLRTVELIHHTNVTGTAETKYSGTHPMVCDSVSPGLYRLRETTRGYGVETYDMNQSVNTNDAVDFTDEDNLWNNVNAEIDEAATDAHWGAQMTFDYFQTMHNYIGLDNDSMALINYVHYDANYTNAFWNGSWATFGDGNSNNGYSPLTSLDVVAHEFGHGITEFNANLVYMNEPGALNESFSDIIGALVEFWATPGLGDWKVGEDFDQSGNGFRDMSNPKPYGDPNTYLGENWYEGPLDNGGVHSNSGVQNFWFYLLSDGGTGTNDNSDDYNVVALGQDVAGSIAIRNLRYYLSVNSSYEDAREGALQAAEDLYGVCSFEYIQTANAWYAVGLGDGISSEDVRPLEVLLPETTTCGLSDMEFPLLQIRYNGCNETLDSATLIPIGFQVGNGPITYDTIELTMELLGGDNIEYQSDQPVSGLEGAGFHVLSVWTDFAPDDNKSNDTLEIEIFNILEQNSDFSMEALVGPGSNCFLASERVDVVIGFYGCDSIAAGAELNLFYRLNGGAEVMETLTLPQTIYSFEIYGYSFNTNIDFNNETGVNELETWVEFPDDFINGNDVLDVQFIVNPKRMTEDGHIGFEDATGYEDSLYTIVNDLASLIISEQAAATGMFGMEMTGGDALNNLDDVEQPYEGTVWEINEKFSAKTCFCVDAIDADGVLLSFDLRQTFSAAYMVFLGYDVPEASSLRVLVDDEQISGTFNPNTYTDDPFENQELDLSEWAGSSFELCFETRNILAAEFDPIGDGDYAFVDNIRIEGLFVGTEDLKSEFKKLRVSPNPTDDKFNLTWQSEKSGEAKISIYDIYGKKIIEQSKAYASGVNAYSISLESAAPGAYLIKVSDGKSAKTLKVLKL